MDLFLKGQKVGYVHRQFLKTGEGYRIMESVFMRISTMELVQGLRIRTIGGLDHPLALSTLDRKWCHSE